MTLFLLVLLGAIFLLAILAIIVFLIMSENKKSKAQVSKKISKNPPITDLESMIKKAKDENLSDEELKELAKLFVATHKLGSKTKKELSKEVKDKLEFVCAFAANSKSSAVSISFLNSELKKLSASYAKEIDAYEQMGLAKRKLKKAKD